MARVILRQRNTKCIGTVEFDLNHEEPGSYIFGKFANAMFYFHVGLTSLVNGKGEEVASLHSGVSGNLPGALITPPHLSHPILGEVVGDTAISYNRKKRTEIGKLYMDGVYLMRGDWVGTALLQCDKNDTQYFNQIMSLFFRVSHFDTATKEKYKAAVWANLLQTMRNQAAGAGLILGLFPTD